jgi:hypothetical protein
LAGAAVVPCGDVTRLKKDQVLFSPAYRPC